MVMSDSDLFMQLRQEFFSDPDGHAHQWTERLDHFTPAGAVAIVGEILALCHNLKGTSQVVGLSGIAAFLHEVETCLQLVRASSKISQPDCHTFLLELKSEYDLSIAMSRNGDISLSGGKSWKKLVERFGVWLRQDDEGMPHSSASGAADSGKDDDWGMGRMPPPDGALEAKKLPETPAAIAPQNATTTTAAAATTTTGSESQTLFPDLAAPAVPPSGTSSLPSSGDGWGLFDDDPPPQVSTPIGGAPDPVDPISTSSAHNENPAFPVAQAASESPRIDNIPSPHSGSAPRSLGLTSASASESQKKDSRPYLLCVNGSQQYAFSVTTIREILEHQQILDLPLEHPQIDGVISIRGLVLPVVRMDHVFGGSRTLAGRAGAKRCILVCEVDARQFGVCIDSAQQVIELSENDFHPVTLGSGEEHKAIEHITHVDGKSTLIVDLERVVI